jgi:predicted dehydrogenase
MNRRDFFAGAAAMATTGMAQTSAEPVRTGHVGTGNRGAYLLKAVVDQSTNFKVTAVCDIKPDRLDKAASMAAASSPKTYKDYRALLENKDVEAVYIATPCDLHVEMALAALKAGKHVYCEKPAGINGEGIKALLAAGRKSDRVIQFGQQMRSDRRLAATVAKIHEGAAGKVVMLKAQRHAGEDLDHTGPSADWFFNAKRSGDVIVEMAVHNLDVCNWIIGSRPERAGGFGGALIWANDPPGRTNMDGYTLSYEYANGVKSSFTQVFFHPNGMPNNGQYFYAYTTEGAVDVSAGMFYPRARGGKPTPLVEPPPQGAGRGQRGPDPHILAFFEAIRNGKKSPAGLEIGCTAALTAVLGRDAIYTKRVKEWKEFGVDL